MTNIIFKAINLVMWFVVISLTFSITALLITSINGVVYNLSSGDPMEMVEEFNASSEEELNQNIYSATDNIMMLKDKSSHTMEMLDRINAAVLGAGADVLSAMGQEDIAQIARKQSVKLKIRTEMLEYASHFNETGCVEESQKEAVEEDFEDMQKLLGYYEELQNGTEKNLFEQMDELME